MLKSIYGFGGSNLSDVRGKTFLFVCFFRNCIYFLLCVCVNYRNLSSQNMFCLTGRGDQNKNSNQHKKLKILLKCVIDFTLNF